MHVQWLCASCNSMRFQLGYIYNKGGVRHTALTSRGISLPQRQGRPEVQPLSCPSMPSTFPVVHHVVHLPLTRAAMCSVSQTMIWIVTKQTSRLISLQSVIYLIYSSVQPWKSLAIQSKHNRLESLSRTWHEMKMKKKRCTYKINTIWSFDFLWFCRELKRNYAACQIKLTNFNMNKCLPPTVKPCVSISPQCFKNYYEN